MKRLAYYLLGAYAIACLALFSLQRHLLYFPSQTAFDDCSLTSPVRSIVASDPGNPNEEWRYYSLAEKKENQNLVIFFHGNAGRACDREYIAEEIARNDIELWLFEYPGYSEPNSKKNDPSEQRILNSVKALSLKIPTDRKVFFMGESLGTGVATYASTLINNAGLILFSPYTSIAEVGQFHYPFFPIRLLSVDKFQANVWAEKSLSPRVIAFHSENDEVVPFSIGQQQTKNFKAPVEFITNKDRGHNSILSFNNDLWSRVREFVLKR